MLQPSRGTLWVELCQRSKRLAPPLLSQKSTVIAAPAHKQEVIKWPESHQYISSSQALYNDDTIFSSTFINRYCIPCSMYYTYSISCEFYSCSKSSVCNSWQWSCCHATRQCALDDFALANICVDLKLCLSQSEYEVRKLTSKELQKHGSKTLVPSRIILVLMDVDLICIRLQHMLQFDRCAEDTLFHSQHHHAPQVSLKELQGCAVGIKPSAKCNWLLIYFSFTEEGTQQKILYWYCSSKGAVSLSRTAIEGSCLKISSYAKQLKH